MATVDNRIHSRIPANFKVNFIHSGNYFISCSRDISINGMFICTKNPLSVGKHLQLTFPSDDLYDIEIPAIVVWVTKEGRPEEFGMGVQFLSILPFSLKKEILQVVDRVVILNTAAGTA